MNRYSFVLALVALAAVPSALSDTTPSGYRIVQGIASTGSQYVYTDFCPDPADTIEVKVKFASLTANSCIWCARKLIDSGSQSMFFIYNNYTSTNFRVDRSSEKTIPVGVTPTAGVLYVFRVNYATREIFVNGALNDVMPDDKFPMQEGLLSFFASHEAGDNWQNKSKMILYYARVYGSDGTLKREYLPARCLDGGAVGLYETKEGKFFGNSGSDRFREAGGPEIITEAVAETDGTYVFGTDTFSISASEWAQDGGSKHGACKSAFYDFSEMSFTPAPTIRFTGGLIADGRLPDDATIDVSGLKSLFLASQEVYPEGTPVVIPPGAQMRYMPGYFTLDDGYWYYNQINIPLVRDLEVKGTWRVGEEAPYAVIDGRLSGTGTVETANFNREIVTRGDFAFTGTIKFSGGACGTHMLINSTNVTGKIARVQMEAYDLTAKWWYDNSYHRTYIRYDPACGHSENPLRIGEWASQNSYYAFQEEQGKWWRCGNSLNFWNDNRVIIDKVTGSGGIHIVANTDLNSATRAKTGNAYLEIGNITSTATLFLSTNVYVTVGTVSAGATFDYACESNAVTTATLDITNSCSTTAKVRARDLATLPARITGFKGEVTLTETDTKTYPVTIDFDADVANYGGCDGSGRLVAAPTAGTIDVTLKGTPKRGNYALARFTSGGELLAGWRIVAPNVYHGHIIRVVKDETGLWFKSLNAGMIISIR